jgi:zinc protease
MKSPFSASPLLRLLALSCAAGLLGFTTLSAAAPAAAPAPAPASASIAANIVRTRASGVDVLAYRTGVKDVVTVRGSLPAGDVFSPDPAGVISSLTGMMLDKGTTTRDRFAIAAALEAVGAELRFSVGSVTTEFSGKCLAKDLPLLVSLIAEQLRNPALTEEEFAKAKKQFAGNLRRRMESPDARASDAFAAAVFPVGHPNHHSSIEETQAAIEKATLADVRAFHAAHYGPARLVFVAVGDLDPAVLNAEVTKAFAGWTGGKTLPAITPAPATTPQEKRVQMAEKPSVNIYLGQATGLRHSDPDALALRVGTAILGSGFTGRLMSTVRDKEGLTYGIYASVGSDTFCDGQFALSATFAPAMLAQGLVSSRRELKLWFEKGVTADELDRRKSNLAGSFKVSLATTGGLASNILAVVDRGYGLNWLDEYPARLQALTLEQVNGAIRRHLDPDKMTLALAGTLPAEK